MEDFTAPSFSLGIDFEEDQDGEQPKEPPSTNRPLESRPLLQEPDQSLDSETLDPDIELEDEQEPRPVLKRLRRGPPSRPAAQSPRPDGSALFSSFDDEIEEFSSQEEDRHPDQSSSLQSRATCSGSKIPLHCSRFLNTQSATKVKVPKISPGSNASTSMACEASCSRNLFPKLTVSPLRRIHLLDSDSDDPSSSDGEAKASRDPDASLSKRRCAPFQSIRNEHNAFQSHKSQAQSFWKDFNPKENVNLTTPALDEFCEEYFRPVKDKKSNQYKKEDSSFISSNVFDPEDSVNDFEDYYQQNNLSNKMEHNWDSSHPQPPAYKYFYHDDVRIQTLIRERLPYFVPLGTENNRGAQQLGAENLDYMGQFNSADRPSQARGTFGTGSVSVGSKTTRGRRPTTAIVEEASRAAGGWVNPRTNATIPKDAGKRRVSADSRQSGQWFTGQNGRKVYVAKNGQELTGRIAYSQYRKDSGAGFPKSKKKAAAKGKKKQAAAKGKRKR